MNDLDLATQKRLSDLTERLRVNDPLSVTRDGFLEGVKARVAEKLPARPKTLKTEYVVGELQSASQRQKHQVFIRSVGTVQHVGNGIATLSATTNHVINYKI